MKVAVIFDHFGPYHVARIRAALQQVNVVPIELFGHTNEYAWEAVDLERITILNKQQAASKATRKLADGIERVLSEQRPDAVAVNGWSHLGALAALYWCRKHHVPAIVMSESAKGDELRVGWKESIKKRVIRLYAAGLVGGVRHISYLKELGMKQEQIFTGYDVVDNQYFQEAVACIRTEAPASKLHKSNKKYFLVSSRFIHKKNLPLIIRAYDHYKRAVGDRAFDLVILGDGPLRPSLEELIREKGLTDHIQMPGFRQYHELPYYYANAAALIHASTTEQWGLVINEAMAAGLPVIVSENCGCAPELVEGGMNGFTFNPMDRAALTNLLIRMTDPSMDLEAMGRRSREIIRNWQPRHFAEGLADAAILATETPSPSFRWHEKVILKSLMLTVASVA